MASAKILRAARQRITDPKNWTRDAYARDEAGRDTYTNGDCDFAVCWCAYGALGAEGSGVLTPEADILFQAALELYEKGPVEINDALGHEAVLRVYDRAIEIAEQSQ